MLMMDIIIKRVIGWILFWYISYRLVKRINSTKCAEYSCRIITELHAIVITVITCKILFFSGTWPFDILGMPNTPVEIQIMCASLGYFIYDFLWCLFYMTEGPVMLVHHLISIITMTISLWLGVSGTEVVSTIFGSETSSIFLNFRWFIKYHKKYESVLGMATDITFVILFVGVRILLGGYLSYCELFSPAPYIVKMGGSTMYLVNCVFLFQVISFARYKIKKHSKRNSAISKEEQLTNGDKNHNVLKTQNGLKNGIKSHSGLVQRVHGKGDM